MFSLISFLPKLNLDKFSIKFREHKSLVLNNDVLISGKPKNIKKFIWP